MKPKKGCPNVKFALYLKKAGLASRNIVHYKKIILRHRTKIQVSVSVKCDGSLPILIYVAFPCCRNTEISFKGHILRFR